MNTPTLPTIKLTEDWEKFFRDHAQFIPPLDRVHDARDLEIFKLWGQGLWDALREDQEALLQKELDVMEADAEKSGESTMREFKMKILELVDSTESDEEIIVKLRDLCS